MSGKIYAVMSVVSGNGAKYVATNLAKNLKRDKKEGRRVLLVDFDFENPFLAYDLIKHDTTHGIDNLVPLVTESGVSEDIFKENVIQTRIDVDVLRGTNFIGKTKQFSKWHIEGILNAARELYDDVIVVITPRANNAGTVYTLFQADRLILVVRDNYSNNQRLNKTLALVQQYSQLKKTILVVYNFQNIHAKSELNEKLKETVLEVEVAGILEYDEPSIDNVNLEKKDSMFSKSINAKSFADIVKKLR